MVMASRVSSRLSRVFCASCLFVLAILLLAGCDNGGSSGTGGQHPYKIGDQVHAGPWIVTVTHVGTNVGQNGLTPKRGDNFLVIYVLFKNTTSQNQQLAAGGFSLTDSAHKEAPEIKSLTQYSSDQAASGESIQGLLVFEVATTNSNFTLSFSPSSGSSLVWSLQVPAFSGPQGTPTP